LRVRLGQRAALRDGPGCRRGDANQALAKFVQTGGLDLGEHLAAALLPFFGHRVTHPGDGAERRRLLTAQLSQQQQRDVELTHRTKRTSNPAHALVGPVERVGIGTDA
jgi:hypothetical protein